MDNKFYVSYEAARLLKEKGYRDKTMYGYSSEDQSMNTLDVREDYDWNDPDDEFHSTETGEYVKMFAAPTKDEAIDWLESKGFIVDTEYYPNRANHRGKWSANIRRKDSWAYVALGEYYLTRLEVKDAAIIKALKSL